LEARLAGMNEAVSATIKSTTGVKAKLNGSVDAIP